MNNVSKRLAAAGGGEQEEECAAEQRGRELLDEEHEARILRPMRRSPSAAVRGGVVVLELRMEVVEEAVEHVVLQQPLEHRSAAKVAFSLYLPPPPRSGRS
jgi:hypothetical protein